jgi:membrane protein implicated in regulation of membrane protease activity
MTNSVALIAISWVAIRKPIVYFKVMAVGASCATGAALQQLLNPRGNIFALLFTTVLVLMISWRFASNRGSNRRL